MTIEDIDQTSAAEKSVPQEFAQIFRPLIAFLILFRRAPHDIVQLVSRVPTDAEGLQDAEHDGARTCLGPPLPGRSPRMVVVGSSTVLQLDGPPRSSGVSAAPSSAPWFPLRTEDAEGRAVHRTRPISRPDDPWRPRIWPRNLRDGCRQRQRRRSLRTPCENHAFLLDLDLSRPAIDPLETRPIQQARFLARVYFVECTII